MIPSSVCPPWPSENAANAAQDSRSYTTPRGTIRDMRLLINFRLLPPPPLAPYVGLRDHRVHLVDTNGRSLLDKQLSILHWPRRREGSLAAGPLSRAPPRSAREHRRRLKRILKLDRLRVRGSNGVRDEFHLPATAQNLCKLAKLPPEATRIPRGVSCHLSPQHRPTQPHCCRDPLKTDVFNGIAPKRPTTLGYQRFPAKMPDAK